MAALNIERWLEQGKAQGATHVIVVCDQFDWFDYPVYVTSEQNVQDVERTFNEKDMQHVMEIYNFSIPIEQQLRERRAYHP